MVILWMIKKIEGILIRISEERKKYALKKNWLIKLV